MAKGRRVETEVERTHGHCADVLMSDYGVPKGMREEVCRKIAGVWQQNTMIHCLIISSVRGYQPHPATKGLEHYLRRHGTHEPKNHKKERVEWGRSGHFDSQGFYHPHGR